MTTRRRAVANNLRAGSTIDQVRGVCANVIGWSNGSNTALSLTTSSTLPARGNGGSFQQRRCNVGSFMTGWWIRRGDMVDALRPSVATPLTDLGHAKFFTVFPAFASAESSHPTRL
jgi:hypothetical protein